MLELGSNSIGKLQFRNHDIDAVVLMPKGRGRKFATTCIRSDPEIKAVSSKMRECLKIYAGVSPGTKWLVRDHSYEWEQ